MCNDNPLFYYGLRDEATEAVRRGHQEKMVRLEARPLVPVVRVPGVRITALANSVASLHLNI